MNERTAPDSSTPPVSGDESTPPAKGRISAVDRDAEKRSAAIARKKVRKKAAAKAARKKADGKKPGTAAASAPLPTTSPKRVAKKKLTATSETPKKIVRKKAVKKKISKKKTLAKPAEHRTPRAARSQKARAAKPVSRLVSAMEELRAATQEYVYLEMEAQRQAILEVQKSTHVTLQELETATLRTLRKLVS